MWLGLDVGSDIALANAMAREIIHAGLADTEFIASRHHRLRRLRALRRGLPLERAEQDTGVPADAIKEVALAYARADRA